MDASKLQPIWPKMINHPSDNNELPQNDSDKQIFDMLNTTRNREHLFASSVLRSTFIFQEKPAGGRLVA